MAQPTPKPLTSSQRMALKILFDHRDNAYGAGTSTRNEWPHINQGSAKILVALGLAEVRRYAVFATEAGIARAAKENFDG